MRLTARLKKLVSALPACDPRVRWLAPEGQVPIAADRCVRCGGSHVLYIEEVVVTTRDEAEAVLARNDPDGGTS
ncbi:unnamed protein product [Gemmataceae bacterium]|nr:unnamed protein product [Gemmataceae bacterium]VTU02544.1 unnamed protein product [Gemmataceae bacterium]